MGGPVATTRGGMVHTVLRLCCAFEDALTKAIDGGKDGEERPAIPNACDRISQRSAISETPLRAERGRQIPEAASRKGERRQSKDK